MAGSSNETIRNLLDFRENDVLAEALVDYGILDQHPAYGDIRTWKYNIDYRVTNAKGYKERYDAVRDYLVCYNIVTLKIV